MKQERGLAIAGSNPANIELFAVSEQVWMCLLPDLQSYAQTDWVKGSAAKMARILGVLEPCRE